MRTFPVDLHCHTSASDGLNSPHQVIEIAKSLGIKAIGITDHDTIAGWEEAEAAGDFFGVKVIRGLEINTDINGTEVHILGYEFDPNHSELVAKLQTMRTARSSRIEKIIEKLNSLGINICLSEVLNLTQGESVGRPHVAQVLVDKGYVSSIKEAFEKYISKGAPGFVERYKISPETAIKLIRDAGGVAVLAHPGTISRDIQIEELCHAGLQGIEVSHSDHTPEDYQKFSQLAQAYRLIPTGGSDFHGEGRKPGVTLGRWGTTLEVMEEILSLSSYAGLCTKGAK